MLDENFWNEYSKVYDLAYFFVSYQELLKEICEELRINRGEEILEAGCGSGNLAFEIYKSGAKVVGLDNSEKFLKICQKKYPEIKTVFADLRNKLPFPDESFDKIASNNALYALSPTEQLQALKEFYRILKLGGRLVIVSPCKKSSSAKIFLDHLKKDVKQNGFFHGFINIFRLNLLSLCKMIAFNFQIEKEGFFLNPEEQKELLQKAGFQNIKTKPVYASQAVLASATK